MTIPKIILGTSHTLPNPLVTHDISGLHVDVEITSHTRGPVIVGGPDSCWKGPELELDIECETINPEITIVGGNSKACTQFCYKLSIKKLCKID